MLSCEPGKVLYGSIAFVRGGLLQTGSKARSVTGQHRERSRVGVFDDFLATNNACHPRHQGSAQMLLVSTYDWSDVKHADAPSRSCAWSSGEQT